MGFEKKVYPAMSREDILKEVALPRSGRVFLIRHALEQGISVNEIASATGIDAWFINNMKDILDFEAVITLIFSSRIKALKSVFQESKGNGVFRRAARTVAWDRRPIRP